MKESIINNRAFELKRKFLQNGGQLTSQTFNQLIDLISLGATTIIEEGSSETSKSIRDKLQSLFGDERLDASSIQNLSDVADAHYVHIQAIPTKVWTIHHNLGKHPALVVVDSAGSVMEGQIEYLDTNTIRASFNAAFSGKAYCN